MRVSNTELDKMFRLLLGHVQRNACGTKLWHLANGKMEEINKLVLDGKLANIYHDEISKVVCSVPSAERCVKCANKRRCRNRKAEGKDECGRRHCYTPSGMPSLETLRKVCQVLSPIQAKALVGLDELSVTKGYRNFKRLRKLIVRLAEHREVQELTASRRQECIALVTKFEAWLKCDFPSSLELDSTCAHLCMRCQFTPSCTGGDSGVMPDPVPPSLDGSAKGSIGWVYKQRVGQRTQAWQVKKVEGGVVQTVRVVARAGTKLHPVEETAFCALFSAKSGTVKAAAEWVGYGPDAVKRFASTQKSGGGEVGKASEEGRPTTSWDYTGAELLVPVGELTGPGWRGRAQNMNTQWWKRMAHVPARVVEAVENEEAGEQLLFKISIDDPRYHDPEDKHHYTQAVTGIPTFGIDHSYQPKYVMERLSPRSRNRGQLPAEVLKAAEECHHNHRHASGHEHTQTCPMVADITALFAFLRACLQTLEEAVEAGTNDIESDSFADMKRQLQCCWDNMWDYMGHKARSHWEDEQRRQELRELKPGQAAVTGDWKMKILAMAFRESGSAWFGKRGFSLMGWMVIRRLERKEACKLGVDGWTLLYNGPLCQHPPPLRIHTNTHACYVGQSRHTHTQTHTDTHQTHTHTHIGSRVH